MATGTVVVVVQASDGVEKEQSAGFRELAVDSAPEPCFKRELDCSSESMTCKHAVELTIQLAATAVGLH